MKPPILSIIGKSNSGKTTLLVKIVRRLAQKGYRIGTIKHNTHGFEIDYPGKDSYRHFHAGSRATLILGPDKLAYVSNLSRPLSLNQVVNYFFKDVDLVITEGFKRENKPKIEVVRSAISKTPLCRPKGDRLIVLVTDIPLKGYLQPQFRWNEIKKITEFIEGRFL